MAALYVQRDGVINHNGQAEPFKGWTTEKLGSLAVDFMSEDLEAPFFLWLSYLAPHEPWEAREELVERYQREGRSKAMSTLLAMIEHLDEGIGQVLEGLKEAGLADETLVVFLSDNGPIGHCSRLGDLTDKEMSLRNPMAWRGVKGNPWENGQRVPCWFRWPGVLKAGESEGPARVTDLYRTLLAAAGIEPQGERAGPLDGRDLWPMIRKGEAVGDGQGFALPYWEAVWRAKPSGVLTNPSGLKAEAQVMGWRQENWKWMRAYGNNGLYELSENPGETVDQSDRNPERAKAMDAKTLAWFDGVMAEGRAFEIPAFPIGPIEKRVAEVAECRNIGHVPGFAATEVRGGVVVKPHDSVGWSKVGDGQVIPVVVLKSGSYRVRIESRGGSADSLLRVKISEVVASGPPTGEWLEQMRLKSGDARLELSVEKAGEAGVMEALEGVRFEWVGK